MNKHKVKHHRNSDTKTGNRNPIRTTALLHHNLPRTTLWFVISRKYTSVSFETHVTQRKTYLRVMIVVVHEKDIVVPPSNIDMHPFDFGLSALIRLKIFCSFTEMN